VNTEKCPKRLALKGLYYRRPREVAVHFDLSCLPIAYPSAVSKLRSRYARSPITVAVRQ